MLHSVEIHVEYIPLRISTPPSLSSLPSPPISPISPISLLLPLKHPILQAVRTLVADPTEDLDSWLELVTLCRKENMFSLCENLLRQLGAPIPVKATACTSLHSLSRDPQSTNNMRDSQAFSLMAATGTSATIISGASSMPNLLTFTAALSSHSMQHSKVNPRVVLATHKYWWCSGEKARALAGLTEYIASLESHASLMATAADKMKEGHGLGGKADIAVNLNLFAGAN